MRNSGPSRNQSAVIRGANVLRDAGFNGPRTESQDNHGRALTLKQYVEAGRHLAEENQTLGVRLPR